MLSLPPPRVPKNRGEFGEKVEESARRKKRKRRKRRRRKNLQKHPEIPFRNFYGKKKVFPIISGLDKQCWRSIDIIDISSAASLRLLRAQNFRRACQKGGSTPKTGNWALFFSFFFLARKRRGKGLSLGVPLTFL